LRGARQQPSEFAQGARGLREATLIASEISVIIPGRRSRSSRSPVFRNTEPPYTYTAVPKNAGMYEDPGKAGAENPNMCRTMPLQSRVGMLSSNVIQNRSRNIATLCPSCRSCAAGAP
jgi:hypothetical protein